MTPLTPNPLSLWCITGQVLPLLPWCPENAGAVPATTGPWCLWGLGHWRSGFSWQASPLLLLLCCPRAYGGSCHRLLPLQLSAGPVDQREREFGRAAWRDGEIESDSAFPVFSRWISTCQARSWCWMKPTTLKTVQERAPASPWTMTACCRPGMTSKAWSETASDQTSTNLWGTSATVWSSQWGGALNYDTSPLFSERLFVCVVAGSRRAKACCPNEDTRVPAKSGVGGKWWTSFTTWASPMPCLTFWRYN